MAGAGTDHTTIGVQTLRAACSTFSAGAVHRRRGRTGRRRGSRSRCGDGDRSTRGPGGGPQSPASSGAGDPCRAGSGATDPSRLVSRDREPRRPWPELRGSVGGSPRGVRSSDRPMSADEQSDVLQGNVNSVTSSSAPGPRPSLAGRGLTRLVRVYQMAAAGRPSPCRHVPSCSTYAIEAIEIHGAVRGSWLAARRLGRCHPWGTSGYDPVPSSSRDGTGRRATTHSSRKAT